MVVSIDNLGAWLLKANGDRSDIAERAARRDAITHWCVHRSYRTALMCGRQPFVLWVSGTRHVTAGIWAVGTLAGQAVAIPGSTGRRERVPLALRWLDEQARLSRDAVLAEPRLRDLEVLRQPQAANPSFLTRAQVGALPDHLRSACVAVKSARW
jgi:hypothetical protein